MRRFYTKEAYLRLVDNLRNNIEGVSLSTDIIAGFCGETDEDHQDTLEVIQKAQYEQAYMFAYSMRSKTHAFNNMKDDVPEKVKKERLEDIISLVKTIQSQNNFKEIGNVYQVLIDGPGKKNGSTGRTTHNKRVNINHECQAGDIINAKIISTSAQTLFAEKID